MTFDVDDDDDGTEVVTVELFCGPSMTMDSVVRGMRWVQRTGIIYVSENKNKKNGA